MTAAAPTALPRPAGAGGADGAMAWPALMARVEDGPAQAWALPVRWMARATRYGGGDQGGTYWSRGPQVARVGPSTSGAGGANGARCTVWRAGEGGACGGSKAAHMARMVTACAVPEAHRPLLWRRARVVGERGWCGGAVARVADVAGRPRDGGWSVWCWWPGWCGGRYAGEKVACGPVAGVAGSTSGVVARVAHVAWAAQGWMAPVAPVVLVARWQGAARCGADAPGLRRWRMAP